VLDAVSAAYGHQLQSTGTGVQRSGSPNIVQHNATAPDMQRKRMQQCDDMPQDACVLEWVP
jgi:hypothetical protein